MNNSGNEKALYANKTAECLVFLGMATVALLMTMTSLQVLAAGQPNSAGEQHFVLEEGKHYDVLPVPIRQRYPDKIEVTEYFSYGCPHCFQFDPMISRWKADLPEDVIFNRTPAIWNPDYQVLAQAYYTAEALGILEKVHVPMFQAIHVDRKNLADAQAMAGFFQRFGVDPTDFVKVFKSFGVRSAMQQAEARGRSYRAQGVPAFIINGKYLVEGRHTGSNTSMLPIVDRLIEKERASLPGKGS
ncbi:MAG: thiol:disulfide interchange protein DsbA/DsbL [Gammaproteobacteria bacterium]|nr:thiol:disulfide interchange protein DsbA/DsbL [Gammaproteobacteria bacterium]